MGFKMKFIIVCTQFIVFAHATDNSQVSKTITHGKTVESILRKAPNCDGDENLIIQELINYDFKIDDSRWDTTMGYDVEQYSRDLVGFLAEVKEITCSGFMEKCLKDVSEMEYNDTNWNKFLSDFQEVLEMCREDGPESLGSESEPVSRNRRSIEVRETIKSTRSYFSFVSVCCSFLGFVIVLVLCFISLLLIAFSIAMISKKMKRSKPDFDHHEDEKMLDVSSC